MPWNPAQYAHFQAERDAPFTDLLALIAIRPGLRVIDLGCGTGHLTVRLAELLPGSDVLGIDSSPDMLRAAEAHARPSVRFEQAHIEDIAGTFDLVFSHSALQWISDHVALIPRLVALCAPGGQLAVQFPANHDYGAHTIMRAVASEDPFAAALGGWTRPIHTLRLERYAELLFASGVQSFSAHAHIYPAVLADADALREWLRGTGLIPYLERLPEALRAPFLDRITARFRAEWPGSPVLYPVKRFLLAARIQ